MKKVESLKTRYIIIGITAAIFLFAVIFIPVFLFVLSKNHVILPWDISYENIEINDEKNELEILLYNKEVIINKQDEKIWKSEDGVKVSNIIWDDIDRDGEKELILLCWKKGRFGKHKPFWIEKDDELWSQHIFIYEYDEVKNQIRPKWMASDIGFVVEEMKYEETGLVLKDKRNDEISIWIWNGWGLERIKNG